MNKWEIESKITSNFDGMLTQGQQEVLDYIEQLQQKVKQLETNIKDSIERHKETIQDTKDFYRPLEDRIYSGSTLIDMAEVHIAILERGKED